MGIRSLVSFVLSAVVLAGQDLPIGPANVTSVGVLASMARHDRREALRLIEADDQNRGGLAVIKGVTFRDGTIEVDVAGRRGPYAEPGDRGFIGVAFRVDAAGRRYENLYLRPENGRADDQVRRNHSLQYTSEPEFPWQRMRKEFPEKYESYTDLVPGEWTRMRIAVAGTTARLFVNGAAQPNLVIDDLKRGPAEGGVAFWIGSGTEGFFANLRIAPR